MTRGELRSKAARKLNEVLRALILDEAPFPLPIRIAKPKTTAPLSEWRDTISLIQSESKEALGYGYTVEWETVNSRRHGKNKFPSKLSFACTDDFLKYLGAESEARVVQSNVACLCEYSPKVRPWCADHLGLMRKPYAVIQNALKLIRYLKANPAPGLYPRQLPLQVPTKFFEQERALVDAMIQEFAPECIVQDSVRLEERLGLMTKESLIEFRSLDNQVDTLPFHHAMATAKELANKAHYFAAIENVLIVENHVTFLTLPDLPKTLAIMGNGFAVHRLASITWLHNKQLFYWGDIDLSGFSILAKLRENYPQALSVMMDTATFTHFRDNRNSHSAEQRISTQQMQNLSAEEQAMVEQLQTNSGQRLEQEHIDYSYAIGTLSKCLLKH